MHNKSTNTSAAAPKNQNLLRIFFKYVSLNISGQLAYSCYTLADTFFVSADLGADGLTALNLAFPVFCFIGGTGLMLGMGAGTKYSIQKARGEEDAANRTFTHAAGLAVCFAAAFVLAGIFLSGNIAKLLGANAAVFPMTNTYLKVMMLFAPAFLANHLLQCFVRNDGNPSLSMAAMITGSLSNIVLDYIFIFPLGLGIFGAILATGMAPVISLLVLSRYFIGRKRALQAVRHGKSHEMKKCRFSLVKCTPQLCIIADIVSAGIPAWITEAASGIVMIVFNVIILRLSGNVGVAAYGVVAAVSLVVVSIFTGLSQGIQPVLALNFGLKRMEDVKRILQYALVAALLLAGVVYAVIFFGAVPIAAVFNSERNEVLQEIAQTGLRLYFLSCPFVGFNIVVSTYFTSTEHPRPAQAISLARGFFVIIPAAFLLSACFGMTGVWFACPGTELLVAGIALYQIRFAANVTVQTGRKTVNGKSCKK